MLRNDYLRCATSNGYCMGKNDVQLLQVAVGNVVAAPVGHRIELDAVGELHLVLLLKPLPLLQAFDLPSLFTRVCLVVFSLRFQVAELVLDVGAIGCVRGKSPSSLTRACRALRMVDSRSCRTGARNRGGIVGEG